MLGDRDQRVPFDVGIELISTSDTLNCACRFRNYRWTLHLGPLLVAKALSLLTSQPTELMIASLCQFHLEPVVQHVKQAQSSICRPVLVWHCASVVPYSTSLRIVPYD